MSDIEKKSTCHRTSSAIRILRVTEESVHGRTKTRDFEVWPISERRLITDTSGVLETLRSLVVDG